MAVIPRGKIAVLFCGGTVLSHDPKAWERVRTAADMQVWLDHVPELQLVADILPVFVTGKEATDIGAAEWLKIGQHVKEVLGRVDGVVILHGIETLHYTANALALMFPVLPIPVVLSGSPLRRDGNASQAIEFGARANIIDAARVATADIAQVCVVFGNRIMLASRVQLELQGNALHLTTVDGSLLGHIDFGTKFLEGHIHRAGRRPVFNLHLDPSVAVMTVAPGSMLPLRRAVESGIHGIVIRTTQDFLALPPDLDAQLEAALRASIPVIVASSQVIRSLPKRFIPLVGVSPSMAVVKSMWAIGASQSRTSVQKLLSKDIAGEFMSVGGPV